MIIALIASLFLFGGSGNWPIKDVKKRIEAVITEEVRVDIAKGAANEIGDALKQFKKEFEASEEDLLVIHQRYDATSEDYEAIFTRLQEDRAEMNAKMMKARETFKSSIKPQEWNAIFSKTFQANS